MKYVVAGRDNGAGFWDFDPAPYLSILNELAEMLPAGARAFALDPCHYDYRSEDRCTKDLRLESLSFGDLDSSHIFLELSYGAPPGTAGVSRLSISYREVRAVSLLSVDHGADDKHRLGHLLVDEIRPVDDCVEHEFLFWSGRLTISCLDLEAQWNPS
jgi:hypothetical protein